MFDMFHRNPTATSTHINSKGYLVKIKIIHIRLWRSCMLHTCWQIHELVSLREVRGHIVWPSDWLSFLKKTIESSHVFHDVTYLHQCTSTHTMFIHAYTIYFEKIIKFTHYIHLIHSTDDWNSFNAFLWNK